MFTVGFDTKVFALPTDSRPTLLGGKTLMEQIIGGWPPCGIITVDVHLKKLPAHHASLPGSSFF